MSPRDPEHRRGRYSRRQLLGAAGTAGIGLGLSACEVSTGSKTSSAGGGGGSGPKETQIKVPDSGIDLPTKDVKFTWMDSDDLKAMFEEPMFDQYHKAHPNITVHYDGTSWDHLNEAVPLGVRNGTAPDVFAKPTNVPTHVMINQGWVSPIDDLIPNFDEWRAKFPKAAFVEGVHVFHDRVYTWPMTSSKRKSNMLFYDKEYVEKAGMDLSGEKKIDWDDFRALCKKITKQGNGKYYGLMLSGATISGKARDLAVMAGMRGQNIDWKTGEYIYADPILQEAIELLYAIKQDGSLFPGGISMSSADARARMPQRVAGMTFTGPWDIPKWQEVSPGYKFGIAFPPVGDTSKPSYDYYHETGANFVWLFSKSKRKKIVADVFNYMGSLEGQTQIVTFSKGNLASLLPEANEAAAKTNKLTSLAIRAQDIADELLRIEPMVQVRNPDSAKVILEMKTITPTLKDICQGYFTGQVKDLKGALKKLNDESNADLDQAVKAARKKGADITRDAWVFPNWDPTKNYTAADYEDLKGT